MMAQPSRRNHRLLTGLLTMCLTLGAAAVPNAHAQDDDAPKNDARVEGYQLADKVGPQAITNPKGTSTAWALLVIVGGIAVGVTFKAGKRTHLD